MLTDIILIGPYGAGKSTLAELLAERLNWDHYRLDLERSRYLREREDYNIDIVNQMDKWELSSPKWQRYNIYFVERFLDEHADSDENCVLDLGAGHSVYKDIRFRSRAKQIFAPYPNVVLILPSKNVEESLELLLNQVRNHGLKGGTLSDEQIIKDNRVFLENPSNYELAKFIVYTRDKTPGETHDEIYQLVCSRP